MTRLQVKQKFREKLLRQFNSRDKGPLSLVKPVLCADQLVPDLLNFIAAFPAFSHKLFNLHGHVAPLGSRLGRGEVLVWFIYDDVDLGGSSTSCDLMVNDMPIIEVKAATREGEKYSQFMLGIDEVPASLKFFYRLLKLFEKNDRLGKLMLPQNFANISKSKLDELKTVSPTLFNKSVEKYFTDLLDGPVGQKTYLIFDKDTGLPVHLGPLEKSHLRVERISGGLTRISFCPQEFTS